MAEREKGMKEKEAERKLWRKEYINEKRKTISRTKDVNGARKK
jgi:hypothetical protein